MRKILILLLVIGMALPAAAVSFSFGVKAGGDLNITELDGLETRSAFGFRVGIFGEIALSDKFSIQPEILFNYFGMKIDDGGDVDIREFMIEIPVLVKYSIPLGGMKLFFVAGGSFALGFNPQYKNGDEWLDISWSGYKKSNISALLGVGIDLGKMLFDVRFAYGIKDKWGTGGEWKVNSLRLSMGYRL